MKPKNKQPFTRLWTPEEHALIKQYYGAIRTTELIEILGRGSIKGINQKFAYYGWTPNEPIYGTVEITYNGEKHLAKGFTYKKEGNTVKNKVITRCRVNKPRKVKLIQVKPVKERKEVSHFKQVKVIQPFQQPEGKVLTLVSLYPKTYKYL